MSKHTLDSFSFRLFLVFSSYLHASILLLIVNKRKQQVIEFEMSCVQKKLYRVKHKFAKRRSAPIIPPIKGKCNKVRMNEDCSTTYDKFHASFLQKN